MKLLFALIAALGCAGCGAPADSAEAGGEPGAFLGPAAIRKPGGVILFEGDANARGLQALQSARAEVSALDGPSFDSPLGGSELDAAITFTWRTNSAFSIPARSRVTASDVPAERGLMSGEATLITFEADPSTPLLRVFTTKTSYSPDASARNLLAIGTWVFATLESASFDEDAIAPENKPVIGQSIPICVNMN